ncbi:hypothetical protein ACVWXO_001918 [Bradyrhizobium sp. LM2.7]
MTRSWLAIIAAAGIVLLFFPMLANREQRARFDRLPKNTLSPSSELYDDVGLREISERGPYMRNER